ncbi:Galactose oxidase, central domain [Nakaseomyces glabratus]|nr:hypothetical protein LTX96_0000663 [Nakaseomyces glabratus]
MSLLLPSACACYPLHLPSPYSHPRSNSSSSLNSADVRSPTKVSKKDKEDDVYLDEALRKRLTLDVRTGSTTLLTRSNIYVNGGLTIPLNLTEVNSTQLQKELMLYFAKEKNKSISFKNLNEWISSETFFLDLISRSWRRLETTIDESSTTDDTNIKTNGRLFHAMCFNEGFLYIFGGLMISPHNEYEFVATNDLWQLDLRGNKWSLLSKDPGVGRRYNHEMHVLNSEDPTKDTKLVIVGGIDNMDEPVAKIDIFNLTTLQWESNAVEKTTRKNSGDMTSLNTNIDGLKTHINMDNNFSVMLDNSGKDSNAIPTLGFYLPIHKRSSKSYGKPTTKKSDSKKSSKTHASENSSNKDNGLTVDTSDPKDDDLSPVAMLPLLPNTKGTRLTSRKLLKLEDFPKKSTDDRSVPYNLMGPSGDSVSYSIIASGFHNNFSAANFHCYFYNVCSDTWTKLCTNCQDSSIHRHRFWKTLVWKSHHQAILLGTANDDGQLPSVQKFDYLLSISLPMLNGFNRILHEITPDTNIHKKVSLKTPITPLTTVDKITQSQPISPISSPHNTSIPDPLDPRRNLSLISNPTSQFENYIRYITDPLEMESTSSVFPPYAMVLGKDTLEVFGKTLADFEFITNDGESIGVPMFLLRKRWGRYFDRLLAQGYSKVCEDYRSNGVESTLIKYGSENNPILSASKTLPNKYPSNHPKIVQEKHKIKIEKRSFKKEKDNEKITSSSNGMVFRVPFKGCDEDSCETNNGNHLIAGTLSPSSEEKNKIMIKQKSTRTSSLVVPPPLQHRRNSVEERTQLRRLSHPAKLPNGEIIDEYHFSSKHNLNTRKHHHGRYIMSNSSSRKASIVSQNSLLSFVSSSSDRRTRGNSRKSSVANMSGASSPKLMPLQVNLPPQPRQPSESVPLPPLPTNLSLTQALSNIPHHRRNSHNYDYIYGDRSSASASRRSSIVQTHRYSISSDPKFSMSEKSYSGSDDGNATQRHSTDRERQNDHNQEYFKRAYSWSSDAGSERSNSDASNKDDPHAINSVEIEPLLIPRSLYMPWPAVSVKAFTEFFYTGQINGKWPLSPVTLDLWMMSKVYEIRLLYDLITEALYSIIGKKEGSILVNCNSLIDLFISKVNACYEDNEKCKIVLENNEAFRKLVDLRNAVKDIESGFLDTTLMEKSTRIDSISTGGSYFTEGPDGMTNRKLSLSSNNLNKHFRALHNNSQQSFGSRSHWKNSIDVRSISLAIPEDNGERQGNKCGRPHSKSLENLNEIDSSSEANSNSNVDAKQTDKNSSVELEEQIEQVRLQTLSDIALGSGTTSPLTDNAGISNSMLPNDALAMDTESLLSTISDSDEYDMLHDEMPLNMMTEKVREEKEEFEGSIDPLYKLPSTKAGSTVDTGTRSSENKNSAGENEIPPFSTLENMMSPNALPPVDHVLKSICRTAVLVNDGGIMLRASECIEFSKKLKKLKTIITNDLMTLENNTMAAPIPMGRGALKDIIFGSFQKFDSEPNIQRATAVRPPLGPKTTSHNVEVLRKPSNANSIYTTQSTISPRTSAVHSDIFIPTTGSMYNSNSANTPSSILTNSASKSNTNQRRNRQNSRFNSQASGSMAVLMNPAVMPPPPPSSPSAAKSKKEGPPSTGPLSFLGIKK